MGSARLVSRARPSRRGGAGSRTSSSQRRLAQKRLCAVNSQRFASATRYRPIAIGPINKDDPSSLFALVVPETAVLPLLSLGPVMKDRGKDSLLAVGVSSPGAGGRPQPLPC